MEIGRKCQLAQVRGVSPLTSFASIIALALGSVEDGSVEGEVIAAGMKRCAAGD